MRDSRPVIEERRLLRSLSLGDRRAGEELVERTYGLVYPSLFRLCRDPDLAADLTQETYRKAWSSLAGFDGRSSLSTWLYRIAYNTYLNHLRRPQRLVPLEEEQGTAIADPSPGADESAGRAGEDERVRRAVLALPDDLRFAVTARFWGGLPVREVARLEGLTTMGMRKRLRRAFQALASALGKESS